MRYYRLLAVSVLKKKRMPSCGSLIPKACTLSNLYMLLLMIEVLGMLANNLSKRRKVEDRSCLFCNETEIVTHLFFDCCVSCVIWGEIFDILDRQLGSDFKSVAKWWICDKNVKI
jgi:hypothetical protein